MNYKKNKKKNITLDKRTLIVKMKLVSSLETALKGPVFSMSKIILFKNHRFQLSQNTTDYNT